MNEEFSRPDDSQPGLGEDASTPDLREIEAEGNEAEVVGEDRAQSPEADTTASTPTEAEGDLTEESRRLDGSSDSEVDEESEDEAEDEAPVWIPEPDKLLLSLLFASHEYLDARSLREIMGPEWDTTRLRQLMRKINRELESTESPFEVVETEGTFRVRTKPQYYPWTRKLFKESAPRRLSQAALETLAIVAYKQPVTKAEIEAIRGVNVDGSMKTLLDKRLIDIGRRSDALGQAFTYHTTRDFMRYFGISRVPDDLPRLSEFEGILNAQTLIPQMGPDGEVHEVSRDDEAPDAEQLSLGVDGVEE